MQEVKDALCGVGRVAMHAELVLDFMEGKATAAAEEQRGESKETQQEEDVFEGGETVKVRATAEIARPQDMPVLAVHVGVLIGGRWCCAACIGSQDEGR